MDGSATRSSDVSWTPPEPGAFTRSLRFGEWISEPVTPLFESWLLGRMEERLHARLEGLIGQRAPRPYHVIVHGWYFYSLNVFGPGAWLRNLPRMVAKGVRSPRNVAGIIPPTVRYSIPTAERAWREETSPTYRAAVADAEARLEGLPIESLPPLIDELADLAGDYFMSIAALGGAAYKMEMNLARFYGRHLRPSIGGSHLALLAGFEAPRTPDRHAVTSLDWWFEPAGSSAEPDGEAPHHAEVVAAREAAEAEAFAALARSPRQLASFKGLLAETQRLVPIREQQARELTLAWPVMRRALDRIGTRLVDIGRILQPDDVYFLTRDEALDGLADGAAPGGRIDTAGRRALRASQGELRPPLTIGQMGPVLRRLFEGFPRLIGATVSPDAIVSGVPASSGRVIGRVRVILGPGQFDQLEPGEILVAPLTAPAWTPLFSRAAAVVTDIGSAASHASVIAREYGIPAVVGCADATVRLRTGMQVVVDGATGNVEPAGATQAGSAGREADLRR